MRKIVVGVIGGGEQPAVACDLGEEIALAGAVLLTGGGEPPLGHKEAKDVAIRGASAVGGRYIGVLPCKKGSAGLGSRRPHPYWAETNNSLLIGTGLSSEGRDPINGVTPDVLFVLQGGAGTLCELAFALLARRRVLFVDSANVLLKKYKTHSKSGQLDRTLTLALEHLSTVAEQRCGVGGIKLMLETTLSAAVDAQGSAYDLVRAAIQEIRAAGVSDCSGFPGIPNIPNSKECFERWLRRF